MPLPNFSALSLRACHRPTGRPVIRDGGGPNPAGLDGEEGAICNICLNPLSEMANNSDADDPEVKAREDAIWAALGWTNMCQQLETCGHQFHTQCLAEVAQSTAGCRNKCPTCRVPLDDTEFNWLQTVTVPPRPGQAPGLPTQPDWRNVCQRLHGESTRREPPGPMRTLRYDDYETAKQFIERKLRQNLDKDVESILAQLVSPVNPDGPGFGRINSESQERLRGHIRTVREELQRTREAVLQSFVNDGTIATMLLMQPERYYRGMGEMPPGEQLRPLLRSPNSRLGERVGNMLAALYPRKWEPWWEPRSDDGDRIGTPHLLRTRVAAAAEHVYAELGRQGLRGPQKWKTGETAEKKALRLLPDLRRLWANGALHPLREPGVHAGQRRADGYMVLDSHMALRHEVLNLYHLTRGTEASPGTAWYAHRDNVTMSVEAREQVSLDHPLVTELDRLAAIVCTTARSVARMPIGEVRRQENELLLPALPEVGGDEGDDTLRFNPYGFAINEASIETLLVQTVEAEAIDERVYRALPRGAMEERLHATQDAVSSQARVRAVRMREAAAAAARWRVAEELVRQRSAESEAAGQPSAQRRRIVEDSDSSEYGSSAGGSPGGGGGAGPSSAPRPPGSPSRSVDTFGSPRDSRDSFLDYSEDEENPDPSTLTESPSYGQWVFAHLLRQELRALDPSTSIELRDLADAWRPTLDATTWNIDAQAWARARGRWELFGRMNPRWGPLSDVNNPRITRAGQWEDAAFGYLDENGNPSSWNAWNTLLEGAAEGYAGPLEDTPWVSDPEERRHIVAFERAVMGRLNRDSSLPTISDDGRAIVSQENYARAVAAQRTWEAYWGTGLASPFRTPSQEGQDAGPSQSASPNPYSRGDAPPNGWKYGQWVFARLLHQELAALDPPILIEPYHLVGTEGQEPVDTDRPGPLLAWTRARNRWVLFGKMDEQWGPDSTIAGRPFTSDGTWRDAAFGYVDEDSHPALWDRWNARVQAAADRFLRSGGGARYAEFERAVMRRLNLAGGARVSQDDYYRAVVEQRAADREAAEAARAAQSRADEAQEALRRQPSEDYTEFVRQQAEDRRRGES